MNHISAGQGETVAASPRGFAGRGRQIGIITVCAATCLMAYGTAHHLLRENRAETVRETAKSLTPVVRTITVDAARPSIRIDLPGSTEPLYAASIFPRVSGYVAERLVDIGSRVKKGDLLAVVQSPDLDRQLAHARAELAKAEAAFSQSQVNQRLAKITADRYAALAEKHYATQQDADNYRLALEARNADVQSAKAALEAQKAEYDGLAKMVKFERLEAPFSGVITARNVDIGDLSNADSGNLIASGNSFFKEAQDDVLRVLVNVPQSAAIGIVDGLTATMEVPEMPGRNFTGKIARNAESLAVGSRTLRVEVDIDNADHALKPGLYVNVHLDIPRRAPAVEVPSEALIFNDKGLQVATVSGGRITLHQVKIAEDRGSVVDVVDGLRGGETIVLNPFANMTDGQKVVAENGPDQAKLADAD